MIQAGFQIGVRAVHADIVRSEGPRLRLFTFRARKIEQRHQDRAPRRMGWAPSRREHDGAVRRVQRLGFGLPQ